MRTALAALLCLLALLPPAPALALSKLCEEAFLIGESQAPPQQQIELLTRCLEQGEPDDVARAMLVYNRGNALFRLGQREKALADYGMAIALNKPRLFEVYNNRGAALVELGRDAEAAQDFSQAIALQPDEAFAYCNRGYALTRLGKAQQAVPDFDQALRLDPGYAFAFYGRGLAHDALGQYAPAQRDYAQTLALARGYAPATNALAWLLATCPDEKLRDGANALALAQKAVEMERSAAHLDTLAAAQARTGKYAEAIKSQEQALALLPAAAKAGRAAFEKRLALYKAGQPYIEPARRP